VNNSAEEYHRGKKVKGLHLYSMAQHLPQSEEMLVPIFRQWYGDISNQGTLFLDEVIGPRRLAASCKCKPAWLLCKGKNAGT